MAEPSPTFICSITHELMVDPVIDPDGNSYERRAIEDWLRQNGTSPITRAPLAVKDLRPNRALQAAIEEFRQATAASAQPNLAQAELKPSNLDIRGGRNEQFIHISLQPPTHDTRSPCDICCVVDTSGSMAVQAEIQTSTNEKFGLSQLDLVKHAMKTIIHSLQPQDRLSLVSFANNATILFHLTKMDVGGKSSALAALERLEDNGQTNLWDGLRTGLDVLLKGQRAVGSNTALFLLTDGCPNVEPPRGHLPTLEKLKTKTNFTCSINTFGFGYDLDSQLLEKIAMVGNSGSYAFIPDGSFVGTIFVNAITTLLTTVATNVQLVVQGQTVQPSDHTRWYSSTNTERGTSFHLGSITSGQSKDFLLPLGSINASNVELLLIYDTVLEKNKVLHFDTKSCDPRADRRLIEQQKFRLEFVNCVRNVFEVKRQSTAANGELDVALNQMKALESKMSAFAASNDAYVKDLLADLTGQVQEAITRDDWFKKWGVHFLPSLTRAHLLQYCNNFKDPGVQHYGQGALFSNVRDEMDTIFCELPAPKAAQNGATIDMAVFNDASGGCFHGHCLIQLFDGTTKLVKNVQPGDRMAPHGGTVTYVVKTKSRHGKAKMVALDIGLLITSWHPIRLDQQWLMPCSLVSAPVQITCDEVYNFALDQGHTVSVNGVECVTLGHGFQEDVVRHAYYGTDRVLADLHQLDLAQNQNGIVQIQEDSLRRHGQSGLVLGLQQQPILVQ